MVDRQLRGRGIRDERVLEVMAQVPRHLFVPPRYRELAYDDRPLPIEHGQTISQPFVVARILESLALVGAEHALDVGTGSGYQAALLSELAGDVISIEVIPELADSARRLLADLGYSNVQVFTADGWLGYPREAPFDAIAVAAAPAEVPVALLAQLSDPGRMVIPIGPAGSQSLLAIEKRAGVVRVRDLGGVTFVPLVGSELAS